ncbi:MAG: sulfite exporter TauE/SafE, partial [Candidatus Paceibacteria bacterium]
MLFAPQDLLPFLSLGILGAAHCAGMCGGFAMAVHAS